MTIEQIRVALNPRYGGLKDATNQQVGRLWSQLDDATQKEYLKASKETKGQKDDSKQTGNDV